MERPPFENEPDPNFYVNCEGVEQRLNMLLRLVRGKEYIILVIGEKGSGKTTLMLRLLENTGLMHRRIVIRAIHKTEPATSDELANLHNRPAWILQDAHTPIVLIDDAHELSRNELLYLLQNTINPNNSETAKRLVLFCEPSLKKSLAEISDAPEGKIPVNTVYMPALSLDETRQYLEDRMRTAGMKGKLPFTRSQIRKIHRSSGGLPSKINQHASRWLENRYARQSIVKRLLTPLRSLVLLIAVLILAALAALFGLKSGDEGRPVSPTSDLSRIKQPAGIKKPMTARADTDGSESSKISPPEATVLPDRNASAPLNRDASRQEPVEAGTAKTSGPPALASDGQEESISEKQQAPKGSKQKPGRPEAPASAGKQKQLAVHREDWLLSQNPDHFTIQILGAGQESALWWFIQNTTLPKGYELAYYEASHDGRPWYPLVFGVFDTREAASETLKKMPQKVRDRSPWIRSLASVQAAIRR